MCSAVLRLVQVLACSLVPTAYGAAAAGCILSEPAANALRASVPVETDRQAPRLDAPRPLKVALGDLATAEWAVVDTWYRNTRGVMLVRLRKSDANSEASGAPGQLLEGLRGLGCLGHQGLHRATDAGSSAHPQMLEICGAGASTAEWIGTDSLSDGVPAAAVGGSGAAELAHRRWVEHWLLSSATIAMAASTSLLDSAASAYATATCSGSERVDATGVGLQQRSAALESLKRVQQLAHAGRVNPLLASGTDASSSPQDSIEGPSIESSHETTATLRRSLLIEMADAVCLTLALNRAKALYSDLSPPIKSAASPASFSQHMRCVTLPSAFDAFSIIAEGWACAATPPFVRGTMLG